MLRELIVKLFQIVIVMVASLMCLTGYAQPLTQKFVDGEYGYSIRYPDDWRAGQYRSGVILSEVNSKDGSSGLQIRRVYLNGGIESFVESYIEDFKRDMRASLINKDRKMIGNISGWVLTFQGGRGPNQFFLKTYVLPVINNHYIYIFQSGTPIDMRERVEFILNRIADSFRLEE